MRLSFTLFPLAAAAVVAAAYLGTGCATTSPKKPTDTPTVTPTFTDTHTPTRTHTFSNTPTFTFTNTFTPTNTRTFTNTFTPSNTFTFSNTFTPTNTFTNTNTPGPTPTPGGPEFIYVVGGFGTGQVSTAFSAPLMASGGLGTWSMQTAYPAAYNQLATVLEGGTIFGCCGYAGTQTSSVYRAPGLSGVIGAWGPTTALPMVISESGVVTSGGYVFVVGGYTTATVSTVYVNTISSSGVGASWTTTAPLPAVRTGLGAIVSSSNYVYAVAGFDTGTTNSTVYSGLVSGGSISGWTSVGNLPMGIGYMGIGTDGNNLFVAGGIDASFNAVMNIYSTNLTGSGGIGTWTTTALPAGTALQQPGVVAKGGYLYILGGLNSGGTPLSAVYSAPITGPAVGSFTTQTAMPNARGYIKPAAGI